MKNLIKRIMGGEKTADSKEEKNNGYDEAHIALCVLMLEAAHADGECSRDEFEHVVSTLTTTCGVEREAIEELIDTSYRRKDESVDIFSFTRYLNNNYTVEQKREVMESVWRVIHLDGRLEAHEDHFAHKLANLLRLSHRELIEAKKRARSQLG